MAEWDCFLARLSGAADEAVVRAVTGIFGKRCRRELSFLVQALVSLLWEITVRYSP